MQQHPRTTQKINWQIINALRGLAALVVVLNHTRGQLFANAEYYAEHVNPKASWAWWEWFHILVMQHVNLGTEFVILFFVLSGFSIAHSLRQNPGPKGFYVRRLVRLYPTYLVGIIWAIVVFLLIKTIAPDVYYTSIESELPIQGVFHQFIEIPNLIKNLLYYPRNNFLTLQYWSLPLEVIFYAIAPFALRYFRWYAVLTILLCILGYILYGIYYLNIFADAIPFQFTLDYGIYFLTGIIFYKNKEYLIDSYKPNKLVMFGVLFLIFETLVILKSYVWHQEHNKITGMFMILFSYISLIGFLKYNIRIRWLEKIGTYSYTLYVTHMATIFIFSSLAYRYGLNFYNIPVLYYWYLGVAGSLLFGYLLFWIAEYPSTKYLEKLRKRSSNSG